MTLGDYMKAKELDDEAMAALIGGCGAHAVKKWRYGERVPRPDTMERIAEVTKGKVRADDLLATYRAAQAEAA